MRPIRFSVASLLGVILVLGVGFAALRESSAIWDSGVFALTVVVLLVSILLAIHRTEKRRAFWVGFALFGSAYLAFSLVPSIESRLITTKALHFLDSKVPRSSPQGLVYFDYDNDGSMDLYVVNNSQTNALFLNKSNGTFEDVAAVAGVKPAGNQAWSLWKSLVGASLKVSSGTTEHFMKIGHSLLAIVAALFGGQLSKYLHKKNPQRTAGPVPAPVSISIDSGA